MQTAHVLIVEDSTALAQTYYDFLVRVGHSADIAPCADDATQKLQNNRYDAVLMDLNLPDAHGLSLLGQMRKAGMDVAVIVITADPSIETAVDAIRSGAQDFISKPVTPARLQLTLANVLEQRALKKIVKGYHHLTRDRFCDFIGGSPAMQLVYSVLENAAQSNAPVFITGESGTGKELAARAIHQLGKRKAGAFEALNCAAVPGNLLESEVFGHTKGAFTGAVSRYIGAAERADGGTLFLDELPEMPPEMQSKLLRFTQSSVFRPLGSMREMTVDVRFVSATNRMPMAAVSEGFLREDLYYRLNVISIHLPPLRERGEDILQIAETFLKKMAIEEQKSFTALAEDACRFLQEYPWPGNVRQLQNVLRRTVVLNEGSVLTRDMLVQSGGIGLASLPVATGAPILSATLPEHPQAIRPLREVERDIVERALQLCAGNITEAARRLEVNASTLHRKMNKWRHGG